MTCLNLVVLVPRTRQIETHVPCPWCGYILFGLPVDRTTCPECGRGVDVLSLAPDLAGNAARRRILLWSQVPLAVLIGVCSAGLLWTCIKHPLLRIFVELWLYCVALCIVAAATTVPYAMLLAWRFFYHRYRLRLTDRHARRWAVALASGVGLLHLVAIVAGGVFSLGLAFASGYFIT